LSLNIILRDDSPPNKFEKIKKVECYVFSNHSSLGEDSYE